MEVAGDSNESRPRRFPDPLPPPQGNINPAAQRREELLWELHKERIRQDILLRELAETERAMAARFGHAGHWSMQASPPSQDYWHQRRPQWLPPWDEAAPRPPLAVTEHPPCPYGIPAAARPPPLYPHVERLPQPPRPADDGEQQQEGESSGSTERPILSGGVDGCQSPRNGTLPEGALVPEAANAGAVTMLSASCAEEVTPGDRVGAGGEHKLDVEDGHGVQPLHESREQSSEQMTAEFTMKDRRDELVARLCQDNLAGQENGTSYEQKQTGFREPTPQAEETSAGVKKMLTAANSPVGGEPKNDAEDGLGVQPLHESGEQSSEQMTVEFTMKDCRDELVARLCQDSQAGQENRTSDEQKQTGFRESTPQAEETSTGVKRMLTAATSPVGREPKDDVEGGHGVQPLYGCGEQSNEQRAAESTVKDWRDEFLAQLFQHSPTCQENGTSGEQKQIGFREPTSQAESGMKRKLTAATSPVAKKQKPLGQWSCDLCQVSTTGPRNLVEHWAGKMHVSKLQARMKTSEEATRPTPEPPASRRNASVAENGGGGGNAARPAEDEDRAPASSSSKWTCNICDAKCSSASTLQEHLGGRRHRVKTEAILAKFKCCYSRKDAEPGKNTYCCNVCDAHCNSDTMLASHLVGRRHRETLLGRD
ncbi:hypothetical protein EJB05_43046 [Eragrostis curvula]|uniref:C2H2-type domain-containing protein n=1 Tax=Eragrostis curvula TaxID=38414 RepID=A0A5J9TDU9_9POAL|nr:hypothetical protein EJB05_43046 [Eragrostis curvula]